MKRGIYGLLAAVIVASSPYVLAQGVPTAITYQGKLTNASGVPVPDGSRAMRIKLFDAQTSGNQLWDSGAMNVVTTGGVFSVALGSAPTPAITSATLTSDSVWVEVTVGTDPALPRVKLTAAPFALRAADISMPFTKTVTSSPAFTPAFEVKNTTANYAIRGESNNAAYAGVMGDNTGSGFGVYGHSETGTAVRGYQQSTGNLGSLGGSDYGVLGNSSLGKAIWGSSTSGYAGYFEGKAHFTGNLTVDAKVGIGTTNPDAKLDVADLMRVQGATWPSAGKGLELGYSGTLNKGYVQVIDRTGGGTWGSLYLGGGTVGIGVTDPNRKLYIVDNASGVTYPLKVDNPHSTIGTDAVGVLFSAGGNGGNGLATDRGKGALVYQILNTWNRGSFYFLQQPNGDATNPTMADAVMAITNGGNVGIGTTNPGVKLEVNGGTSVSGNLKVTGAFTGNLGASGDGAPFPRPAYNSGWISMLPGSDATFTHNLGGDIENYFVEVQHRYGSEIGVTNQGYGGDCGYAVAENHEFYRGFYWDKLTTGNIRVFRLRDDFSALSAWVRVRIWIIK